MISRVLSIIPDRIKKLDVWGLFLKRIIYLCGFVGLCLIDQMIGSATGYIQYGYKNYTGIIIAIFMLTAFRVKDFLKVPYLIWIVLFFLFRLLALDWLKEVIYNDLEVETNLWGIGLYGILLIRMFYSYVIEKKKPHMNWILFGFCMIMLIGMAIIRSDYAWPKALLGIFLCFYLTDFQEKDLNNLFSGMVEGIIIGFLIIQVQAWMYRPYDMVRYEGMYSHPNMNALMYLCAYCAMLCKWYLMKLKRNNIFLRIPIILLAGLVMGTMFFTGGRAAFITAVMLTVIFLIFQMLSCKKKKIGEFFFDGIILSVSIAMSILPAYWLIRYIPVYVSAPLYFETDYANELEGKIKKGDPIDSEKYVELGEAADEMFERYLWFLDDETFVKVERWIREFPDSLSLKVDAANEGDEAQRESEQKQQLILSKDQDGAYDVRIDIYRYFWEKLTLIGVKNSEQGVWIGWWSFATHCHNLFLQIAYDFGIIIGIMFIIVVIIFYIRVLIGLIKRRSGSWYYRLFVCTMYTTLFIVFGMLEIDWTYGQLPFTMFFISQYIVYHKEPERPQPGPKQEEVLPDEEVPELEIVEL